MSDCDSESIHSQSERSSDSDSEGSLADFVVDDEDDELVEACTCRAEICATNVIKNRKRRRTPVVHEEVSDDEESDSDSSSDYVPSEAGDSSSEDESSSDDE